MPKAGLLPEGIPICYRAFGLRIVSDVPLPGFVVSVEDGPTDVHVHRRPVTVEMLRLTESGGDRDGGEHVGAEAPNVLRACVESGREIIVDPDPAADPAFVGAVLTGELFAALLRQRGFLVLHGAGVVRDGVAIGLLGDSGWGKSTLAASLISRGWSMLTDDLLAVEGLADDGRTPAVRPSHPAMRLSPEAAAHVARRVGPIHGLEAHSFTTKLHTEWNESFSEEPVPLRYVFVLDPTWSDAPTASPLAPHVATLELAHHTRVRRLLWAPSHRETHLRQCSALVKAVPVARLQRPFGLEHMDALCEHLESVVAEAVRPRLG